MIPLLPREQKKQAQSLLHSQGQSTKQLVLIHTGVVVLLSLFSSGLNLYLDDQIGATGGLSGLGLRSVLQTIQTIAQYAITLFSPFWSAGFLAAALAWADGKTATGKTLLSGFRRFSSILNLQILRSLLYLALCLATGYIAGLLFTMTPYAAPLLALLEPAVTSGILDLTLIDSAALLQAYTPFLLLWLVILIPVALFFFYSLRLSLYLIVDHPRMGAMRAMAASVQAMRGQKKQMLRLDLSYLWYYILEAALLIVCYLDLILPLMGITLPANPTVLFFVFLGLYGVLQLCLHLWKKPEVDTTYALVYRKIIQANLSFPSVPTQE